jgi:tetratricopeptide (TPR) repeat protein
MRNIFVSYRRKDSSDVTGRIFDHLKTAFGEEHLFKDVDSIPLGTDFREAINAAVQGCDVLLAVIGDDWIDAKEQAGARRIDNPEDYVHLEIKSALDRNIPVIPVLVEGAAVPRQEDLPEPLRRLAFRNAIFVRPDPDFRNDMERLCRDLSTFLKVPDPARRKESLSRRRWLIAMAALLALAVLAVVIARPKRPIPPDIINRMIVINVTIIVQEYEKYQGKPLGKELKQQIERAVATAIEGKHGESIQLLEKITADAPLPSIYTNLGVEYAKLNKVAAAKSAFAKAIEKDPNYQAAHTNRLLLESALSRSSKEVNPITFEASSLPAMLIDPLATNPEDVKEIHVVKAGTSLDRYHVQYSLKPGTPTLVDPANYDIIFKSAGGGNFILAKGVVVKEGQRARINPNILLGTLMIEPSTRKGFPAIKEVQVFQSGTTGYRLIFQQSDKLGVPLPIVPGSYDIRVETADGDEFTLLKNVEVKEREVARIRTDKEVAGFIVRDPKIEGIQVEAIYVLRAGGNEIIAQTKKFDHPMIVPADDSYDIVLKQAGGRITLKSGISAKRGEFIEVGNPPAR